MKRLVISVILLICILFPFEWLARFSSHAAHAISLFGTPASHVVGHAALFAGLALCVISLLTSKPRHWAIALVWVILICAAVGQEAFQSISRGTLSMSEALFDLAVDVVSGGMTMMGISFLLARRQGRVRLGRKATVQVDG